MDDRSRVAALLGRPPSGAFEVVVRDPDGEPIVIANAPLLDDGTPMPTRFWLVGREEVTAVSRLESAGGVRRAEAEIDAADIADAHARYEAMRDELVPPDHEGPRPSGGVGGTERGVKCLHAHYAWHLAGGDDPVGRWVAGELATGVLRLEIGRDTSTLETGAMRTTLRVGWGSLTATHLSDGDPPPPEQLTNALGDVADGLEDVILTHSAVADATHVSVTGDHARAIAAIEAGSDRFEPPFVLERDAAEDVFRTMATERRADRAHNPGLPRELVDTIVAACCIVVGVMRRLHLDRVTVR